MEDVYVLHIWGGIKNFIKKYHVDPLIILYYTSLLLKHPRARIVFRFFCSKTYSGVWFLWWRTAWLVGCITTAAGRPEAVTSYLMPASGQIFLFS